MFSVLVPVFNEARVLEQSILHMLSQIRQLNVPFEVLICENGSRDGTLGLAKALSSGNPEIRVTSLRSPDYGLALRHGILESKHEIVAIFNVDFWSLDFLRAALHSIRDHDIVIGSKAMKNARDQRPIARRLITRSFNGFLRVCFGFRGTDTHGMKMVKRSATIEIANSCITDGWIFDTELILRAERKCLDIMEIPVDVVELRQPSYFSLAKRVPKTIWNLLRLYFALRTLR